VRLRAAHRLMVTTILYTGLRISEMLGLVWDDVDFAAGVIHVRAQLSRAHRGAPARRVAPKTPASVRDVPLVPQLARLLSAHRLRSRFARGADWAFATARGSPYGRRNVSSDKQEETQPLGRSDARPTSAGSVEAPRPTEMAALLEKGGAGQYRHRTPGPRPLRERVAPWPRRPHSRSQPTASLGRRAACEGRSGHLALTKTGVANQGQRYRSG
jgi:integrase